MQQHELVCREDDRIDRERPRQRDPEPPEHVPPPVLPHHPPSDGPHPLPMPTIQRTRLYPRLDDVEGVYDHPRPRAADAPREGRRRPGVGVARYGMLAVPLLEESLHPFLYRVVGREVHPERGRLPPQRHAHAAVQAAERAVLPQYRGAQLDGTAVLRRVRRALDLQPALDVLHRTHDECRDRPRRGPAGEHL